MTDETRPEQPPAQTETEQLRDSVSALQTMVNRVREAVGTDEPAPVRESYRIRELETRVSDAEYERGLARRRAEQAEAALVRVHHLAAAIHAGAPWLANHAEAAARIRAAIAGPAPTDEETVPRALFDENIRRHKGAIARVDELLAVIERVRAARDRMARGRNVDAIWCLDVLDAALAEPAPATAEATGPEDEHDGPIVPPALTDAIRQHDVAATQAVAALARLYGPMADLDHPQHPINATQPANSPLLEQIAAAIGRTNLPMWHKTARYEAADAALSVVLPHGRVAAALQRSAEDTVSRVVTLHEQWVKAGPPPLGAPLARWWDTRLAELHNAIQPADETTEK
jgi:hypothetical protein